MTAPGADAPRTAATPRDAITPLPTFRLALVLPDDPTNAVDGRHRLATRQRTCLGVGCRLGLATLAAQLGVGSHRPGRPSDPVGAGRPDRDRDTGPTGLPTDSGCGPVVARRRLQHILGQPQHEPTSTEPATELLPVLPAEKLAGDQLTDLARVQPGYPGHRGPQPSLLVVIHGTRRISARLRVSDAGLAPLGTDPPADRAEYPSDRADNGHEGPSSPRQRTSAWLTSVRSWERRG